MSKVAIQGNALGSGTFTLAAPNSNTDRTLTLPDEAGTVLTSASSITQNAGPTFHARPGSSQSLSFNTDTKINYDTETFDVGSCYDTSTARFTPNVEGYYMVSASIDIRGSGTAAESGISIRKNGSNYAISTYKTTTNPHWPQASSIVYMNGSTDYLEVYASSTLSSITTNTGNADWFTAALIRGV